MAPTIICFRSMVKCQVSFFRFCLTLFILMKFMDGNIARTGVLTSAHTCEKSKQNKQESQWAVSDLWLDNIWCHLAVGRSQQNFKQNFASSGLENCFSMKKMFCSRTITLISLLVCNSFSVVSSDLNSGLNFHHLRMNLFPGSSLGFFQVRGVRIKPLLS